MSWIPDWDYLLYYPVNGLPAYLLYVLVLCVLLMVAARLAEPGFMRRLLRSAASTRYAVQQQDAPPGGLSFPAVLFDVILVLCLGVVAVVATGQTGDDVVARHLLLSAWIGLAYLGRAALLFVGARLFFSGAEAHMHAMQNMLLLRAGAVLLLPLTVVALFQQFLVPGAVLQVFGVSWALLYVAWLLRLFVQLYRISLSGALLIFLYLCTVELSPLAVLCKTILH